MTGPCRTTSLKPPTWSSAEVGVDTKGWHEGYGE